MACKISNIEVQAPIMWRFSYMPIYTFSFENRVSGTEVRCSGTFWLAWGRRSGEIFDNG